MGGQIVQAEGILNMLVEVREDFIHHLRTASLFRLRLLLVVLKAFIQKNHHLQKGGLFQEIGAVPFGAGDPAHVIEKTVLILRGKRDAVGKASPPLPEAGLQIRGRRAEGFQIVRMDGQDNPFMDLGIDFG